MFANCTVTNFVIVKVGIISVHTQRVKSQDQFANNNVLTTLDVELLNSHAQVIFHGFPLNITTHNNVQAKQAWQTAA